MRNLFLLLLLANLGFAAWYFWVREPPVVTRTIRDPEVPSIALASEPAPLVDSTEASTVPPRVEETAESPPIFPVVRCFGIGPFSDMDSVEAARTILRNAGFDALRRAENGEVWLGHWIFLDNVTNQGQADTLSEALADGGIEDSYFDPTGVDGDVLSLGLFREFNRAETIRILALELGFEPVMVQRTRPGTVYWADVTLANADTLDLTPFQSPGRIVRLEQRQCDSR